MVDLIHLTWKKNGTKDIEILKFPKYWDTKIPHQTHIIGYLPASSKMCHVSAFFGNKNNVCLGSYHFFLTSRVFFALSSLWPFNLFFLPTHCPLEWLLEHLRNKIAIKWKRRRWYTLELITTCQTGQSQGHLREARLANEFCCSIPLIIISNSQQLSSFFFLSRLVRVLLLLKSIDPEAQIPDRLYKWTGQMPMKRQKNLPGFVFVFNLSDG